MSRSSPNEEAKTNIESASHDQERSENLGGQNFGGVSRTNDMNEAAQFTSREYTRDAEEALRMPARPKPISNTDQRGSTNPRSGGQRFPPREDVSVASTAGLAHARQAVTRTLQEGGSHSEHRPEKDQDMYESYSQLEKQNTTLRCQIRELQDECQVHTSRGKSYIRGMKEKEKKLTDEIHELKHENEMREWEIKQAQIKSFRNMKQGRWLPQEESSVRGKLDRLQSNIKQWAKSNAMKSMEEVDSMLKETAVEQDALLKGLGKVVRLVDGALPAQVLDGRHAPFLCLNAMLANEIYMHILADPFFFLEDDIGPIIDSLPVDSSILKQRPSSNVLYGKMYNDLITVDAREAHVWRSQMLRILSPSTDDDAPPSKKKIKNRTEECRRNVCSRHAKSFLEGPGRHLITESNATSDRVQRLEKIFQTAGTLSCQLWTQRTYFRCRGLPELKGESFSIDSPIMELHPLIHLDETPARLNGYPITMVVNPLVQVGGTDEAEDYDQTRVWARAVVWLPLESR